MWTLDEVVARVAAGLCVVSTSRGLSQGAQSRRARVHDSVNVQFYRVVTRAHARVPRMCELVCPNVDPRRSRRARPRRSLCGFNVVWSFSRRAISTRIGTLQCVYVIPLRGDTRARIGAAHVRVVVSECGP
mmetsp:Transcript_2348/g.7780  ORF Transcript_2348/g.7780 Transcript_2348/m.7780 type:complete len:131 (+) Transcript_2348:151-543(+)